MKTRNTDQKKQIIDDISKRADHPTAQMIYESVSQKSPDIGIATIYRNLKTMVDDGQIKKIMTFDNVAHFDLATNDHIHLVCNTCGKIIDVMAMDIINQDYLASKYKFIIEHQDIQINGICEECLKNQEKILN